MSTTKITRRVVSILFAALVIIGLTLSAYLVDPNALAGTSVDQVTAKQSEDWDNVHGNYWYGDDWYGGGIYDYLYGWTVWFSDYDYFQGGYQGSGAQWDDWSTPTPTP